MMDLTKYSRENLFKPRAFSPIAPDGEKLDSVKIWIQSAKSDQAIKVYNKMMNEKKNFTKHDLKRDMEYDIDLAKALIISFEGIKIGDDKLESNEEGIDYLVRNIDFIRVQAIQQAQEDAFFFKD